MIAGLLVAATVAFTLPTYESDTSCTAVGTYLTRLSTVRLYGAPRYGALGLLVSKSVIGREGRPDSLTFADGGQVWSLYVTTVDVNGNESCPSNWIQLNGSVGVGADSQRLGLTAKVGPGSFSVRFMATVPAARRFDLTVYDVSGRVVGGAGFTTPPTVVAWVWDASRAPVGNYFARLKVGNETRTVRFALIR